MDYQKEEIEIKNLDHLGIVAGLIDEIGIVETINSKLGIDPREKMTSGILVKAILINGLGFVSRPLYLFSQFFEDKGIEILLGSGVESDYINDDKIGRVMDKLYKLRIKNNWQLEFEDSTGLVKIGASDDAQAYRVINFCDVDTKTEFRLVTNLPASGDAAVSDDEIRDIYRLRWGVELLWKFLKMHLKLDKLITKNVNGITIQIYISLIAYLILQLLSIPKQWGYTLLDKFRYLQSCMCQKSVMFIGLRR